LEIFSRDLVEGCACPQCNEPLFDLRMSGKELPQFYERIEASPTVSPPRKVWIKLELKKRNKKRQKRHLKKGSNERKKT
jgi:hypothetical protein